MVGEFGPSESPAKRSPRPMRRAIRATAPSMDWEKRAWSEGADVVVGIDEVGRGAWAGPLVVGAVVANRAKRITRVRDSKMLTRDERQALAPRIGQWAAATGLGMCTALECDELGMREALRLASWRAIAATGLVPDVVLIDGPTNLLGSSPVAGVETGEVPPKVHPIVKGDTKCLSIAAASVIAKVARDDLMRREAEHYPGYSFDQSVGYPCPRHRMALAGYGPTPIHRQSWSFMDGLPWTGLSRYLRSGPQLSLFD